VAERDAPPAVRDERALSGRANAKQAHGVRAFEERKELREAPLDLLDRGALAAPADVDVGDRAPGHDGDLAGGDPALALPAPGGAAGAGAGHRAGDGAEGHAPFQAPPRRTRRSR